jgi:NAD-dependent deacetylase sirtuin 4
MADAHELAAFLHGRRVAVLTGAGCSTESGIPDYRGPETRRRARNPIRFQQFVGNADWRQRYWARSFVGWNRVAGASPNAAHRVLADLEQRHVVAGLITQNVDGLHRAAGSHRVIELHGRLADVVCLSCGQRSSRRTLQARLAAANPDWRGTAAGHAPDGDADIDSAFYSTFVPLDCVECGGALKPDVVFFGENVPRSRVDAGLSLIHESEALLVVGSSLTVFSGYRFVRAAHSEAKPVAILNIGSTRGDSIASLRIDGSAGIILQNTGSLLPEI